MSHSDEIQTLLKSMDVNQYGKTRNYTTGVFLLL